MVELLGKQVDGTILKEVRKATAHLKGSNLEVEANLDSGGGPGTNHQTSDLKHKFDKIDEMLREKSNKSEAEMSLRQISILHKMLR